MTEDYTLGHPSSGLAGVSALIIEIGLGATFLSPAKSNGKTGKLFGSLSET